jgi:hypothetical protein
MRDSKILTIYEGTTSIQANDFVGRKSARDGGTTARAIVARIEATEKALAASANKDAPAIAKRLTAARLAFLDKIDFIAANTKERAHRERPTCRRPGSCKSAGGQHRVDRRGTAVADFRHHHRPVPRGQPPDPDRVARHAARA